MKNFLYPLVAAALFAVHTLEAQTQLLSDSSFTRYIDPFTGEEQFQIRGYYTYNIDNLPLQDVYINYFGATTTHYRYDYQYNSQKLLSSSSSQRSLSGITGPWENWLKDDYSYDAQERNIHYIGQLGVGASGWENYYQETFGFDDVTPADSSLYELWNAAIPNWGNYRRRFNYYSPDKLLLHHIEEEWDTNTGQWGKLNETQYTYYPNGKVQVERYFSYNNSAVSIESDSFIYKADGKVDSTFSVNKFSNNVYEFITKWAYDPAGNLVKRTSVRKTGPNNWVFSSRQEFAPANSPYSNDYALENEATYNAATQSFEVLWEITRKYEALPNNRVLFVEVRKQQNGQAVLATQVVDSIWHHIGTGVGTTDLSHSEFANCQFSNPFHSGSGITCDAPDKQSLMNIRITNMHGQIMAQGRVLPGEAWHPDAAWPAGAYFLTAWQNGKYLGMKKMLVVR